MNAELTLQPTLIGNISGVISERDYISKIALLGRVSKETLVKEISTKSSNLMTASPHDSVDECMEKMLSKDIRHLPLLDDDGKVIGMLSVSGFLSSANSVTCMIFSTFLILFSIGKRFSEDIGEGEGSDNQSSV